MTTPCLPHHCDAVVRATLLTLVLCLTVSGAAAVEVLPREMEISQGWVRTRLDTSSATSVPFSFTYAGKSSFESLSSWRTEQSVQELDALRTERTLSWSDSESGLTVRCVATVYRDFPAVEWVLYFRNRGDSDTPILENVRPLHAELSGARREGDYKLYYAAGSHAEITDFQPLERILGAGEQFDLSSFGGRSSDGTLPFFNLVQPGGGGFAVGVGWTGQWVASFRHTVGQGVTVQAGMERTHLSLHPGEEIRTPAILLLFWDGEDRVRSQNLLRRLLFCHYTPLPAARPVVAPSAVSPHAMVGFEDTTQENMLQGIRQVSAHQVPVDFWWIDTGWFTCGRNWARYVGNPDPDPTRFPDGLKPIADAAHQAGMKLLLWFEPERVMPDTWLYEHHGEWLLRPTDEMPAELKYQINDGFHLLDLGNPDALAWVKQKISGMIGSLGIDCYRNDFNMYPLYYWRNQEPPDRQGMREIRYITGLYDFFDTLQREHPALLLDNCASGGRRIDFEMLRRSLVLTRSDYLWDPIGQQCHTYGLAQWIPITGIGAASTDLYSCRSGLGSHFVLAADFYSQEPAVWDAIRRVLQEHATLKKFFAGDFYPLGSYGAANNVWMAWQFHRADLNQGILQVFRRPESSDETTTYRLCGLEAGTQYTLTDRDSGNTSTMTGKELMERGFAVKLPDKSCAAIFTYHCISR